MTITEWLRERCLAKVITTPIGDKTEPVQVLARTEWSPAFEKGMRNRLLVGRFRYGRMGDPEKGKYDCITSAIHRLLAYQKTGNAEHLFDAANLCLVEFVHPLHPEFHLEAGDDTLEGQALRKSKKDSG